jgi:hypothetical protein
MSRRHIPQVKKNVRFEIRPKIYEYEKEEELSYSSPEDEPESESKQ